MRTQYNYQMPSGGNPEWVNRFMPWIEPPLCYLTFAVGIVLAIFLSISGSRYGIHILILLIALPFHELAHAITADQLGDDTPRQNGRITPNPFAQLNLLGSILVLSFGIGWASVPVNPSALRPNPRTGGMIVAVAGPLATLLLAILTAILWHTMSPILQTLEFHAFADNMLRILFLFSLINVALFFFNLLPFAPLDGFTVLKGLLPYQAAYQLEKIQPYSMILFIILFLVSMFTSIDLVGWLIFGPAKTVTCLMFGSNTCLMFGL